MALIIVVPWSNGLQYSALDQLSSMLDVLTMLLVIVVIRLGVL